MTSKIIMMFCLLLSSFVFAQQNEIGPDGNPIPIPVEEDPHHRLLLQNQFARVFRVELPPQKATPLHRHPYDYVIVTLTDGDLETARGIGTSFMTYDLHRGDVRFVHGPMIHRMRNPEGALTHRSVTVEIARNSEQPYYYPPTPESLFDYDVVPPPLDSHVSYQAVLDRDTVRASSVQILAGDSMVVTKRYGSVLVVALEDLELKAEDGDIKRYRRDDVLWDLEFFRRKLTNISTLPARFVLLEFK